MTYTHHLPRLLLALAATALAALAVMASAPRADATLVCDPGDFCLWEHEGWEGGRYNWHGRDLNLFNDHWVGGSGGIVANNASSLYNHGNPGPLDEVVLYHDGARIGCVEHNTAMFQLAGTSQGNLHDKITGFSWVDVC